MRSRRHIGCVLLAGCLAPAVARADHHDAEPAPTDGSSTYDVSVTVLAATFDNSLYGGDYEGVAPAASWAIDRFAAGASWSYYRLLKNGERELGVGDLIGHGQVVLVGNDDAQAGVSFAISAPTGDELAGLGMGHTMLMPAAWGSWHDELVTVNASFGYSRALAIGDHVHGMEPLVEPMNMSELTWSGGAEIGVAGGVRGGARFAGGVPVGDVPGITRVLGALRVAWRDGRVDTAGELQLGLAGDPFNIRGVLQTSLRF